jgi:hypothetical protein
MDRLDPIRFDGATAPPHDTTTDNARPHRMTDTPSRQTMAHAFTALDLKSVTADGAFEGYASLFDTEDLGRDVVAPGAFAASLRQRGAAGIRMLFQHDPAQPIGVWTALREDARGLYAEGRLTLEVAKAREVLALMREGAVDGLSIGFRAVKGQRDRKSGIRHLKEVDLWEISIVTFPMQPQARIRTIAARPFAGRVPTTREFERWLTRDAGLTRMEARAVARGGLQGLAALRDAAAGPQESAELAGLIRRATARLRQSL